VGVAGASFLVAFGVLLPYLAFRSARQVATHPLPPKKRFFTSVIVQLVIFGVIATLIGSLERIELFPPRSPSAAAWGLGAFVLIVLVALMRPVWRRRVLERSRRIWLFMPRDATERSLWLTSSIAAGISEELVYRGVLTTLLARMTGSLIAAALVSAAIFAVSHYMQGWKSMAIILAMALLFQSLAWSSGSLYVPMAVHALYDIAAGLHYGHFGRVHGYPLDPMPLERLDDQLS
jgi:membrane protease YdiL (CAAX protease family)